MKILIIEDEAPAASRLTKMLKNIHDEIEVVEKLDSVEAGVRFLQRQKILILYLWISSSRMG